MRGEGTVAGLSLVGRPRQGGGLFRPVRGPDSLEERRSFIGKRRRAVAACAIAACAIALGFGNVSSAASAYEALVAPIFQARCVECHGEKKQKAKLALHTWESLSRGSDAGAVLVAGKPAESVLIERLRLPLDDEEHMPPHDRPQPSPEEIALLVHWIERGASSTATLDELQLPEPLVKAASTLPAKLAAIARAQVHAEPLWEFDAAAVAKLRAPLAARVVELQRLFPGALSYESRTSSALHFTAAGFGRDFGDKELGLLASLREALVSLDLSGTAITDRSARVLGGFSKLRVLRAGFTEMGDVTAQAIALLPALESLALPETKLSASSVGAFTKMRALRKLRVAGTDAERAAQAAHLPVVSGMTDTRPPVELEKPVR